MLRRRLLSVFVVFLATTSLAQSDEHEPALQSFQLRSASIPELVKIVRNSEEKIITVTGRYDIGLDAESAWDSEAVSKAVQNFIAENDTEFGLHSGEKPKLVPVLFHALDENLHTVRFHQIVGEVRVAWFDIVVALMADGALLSIDGRLVSAPLNPAPFVRTPEGAVQPVAAALSLDRPPFFESEERESFGTFKSERFRVEPVFDPVMRSNAWLVEDAVEDVEHVVADVPGSVVRSTSRRKHASETTTCNLSRFAFPRSATGYATKINTVPAPTTCETDTAVCEGENINGLCLWQLRHEKNITHDIWRVEDADSPQVSMATPCNTSPTFPGCSNLSNVRQETAFWAVESMRNFMTIFVWGTTAPQNIAAVIPVIDINTYSGTCYYEIATHVIRCPPGNPSTADSFWHEYGHHVDWTYGGSWFWCDPKPGSTTENALESAAIGETAANVFGFLFPASDLGGVRPRYGALDYFSYQAPVAHTGAGSPLRNLQCDPVTNNYHSVGRAFEQAAWELMWNRNCYPGDVGGVACSDTMSSAGNSIFIGLNQSAVIAAVGRAFGYAMAVTGVETTYKAIWAHMYVRLIGLTDVASADRAKAVMKHHGFVN